MTLLDTNVCIAFLNGRDRKLHDRLLSLPPTELRLCSVVKAELLYGARKSAQVERNLRSLQSFFDAFESLPFGDDAAAQYGVIRSQLEREGRPIGGNDMLIAAIALVAEVTLATRNQDEFRRVAGLRVETW